MNDIQLVVFDMAGTTVKDGGQVPAAFASALSAHGIGVTPDQLTRVRGASKREAVRQFVPEGPDRARVADLAYADFHARLAALYERGVEPIDGAEAVFRTLRAQGVHVALTTGFDRDITALLVNALGWTALVDAVVCGDDVKQGRPAPYLIFHAMEATGVVDVKRVATIGDTTLDLEAGANAGVAWNVGVLSGAHDRARLEQAPHTHILTSVAALPTLWPPVG